MVVCAVLQQDRKLQKSVDKNAEKVFFGRPFYFAFPNRCTSDSHMSAYSVCTDEQRKHCSANESVYFTAWQAVPVIYLIAMVATARAGKTVYRRYQVSGR